jgi:hypothetical protein
MPAQSYDIAYSNTSNVIPLPRVNFLDEGNTPKYVSTGGGKTHTKRRRHKKSRKQKHKRTHRRR